MTPLDLIATVLHDAELEPGKFTDTESMYPFRAIASDVLDALAAAGLLVTDEIQAVPDAAVEWAQSGPWGGWTGDALEIAVNAYRASRDTA